MLSIGTCTLKKKDDCIEEFVGDGSGLVLLIPTI